MATIFWFELRYRLRQVSTYIYFLILFGMAYLLSGTDALRATGGANLFVNSPFVVDTITSLLTALGVLMISALAGTAIYRDFEYRTHELFFTSGISRRSYFFGRFLGALAVILLVFSGILLGQMVGRFSPALEKSQVGPFHLATYFQAFWLIILPNALFISALSFICGALTRSLLAVYTEGVVLLVGYLIAAARLSDLENRALGSLLDPFGRVPVQFVTEYWTVSEKDYYLIPLSGYLLWNRLLWIGISLAIFLWGYRRFAFAAQPLSRRSRRSKASDAQTERESERPTGNIEVTPRFGLATAALQCGRMVRSYLVDMVRGTPFRMIVFAGLLLLITYVLEADKVFGTTIYPVTRVYADAISTSFMLFFLILLTFYAGELTWKERVAKLDQIHDALPLPDGITLVSKILAVIVMQALLLLVLMATGMIIQAAKGYFHFEVGLYLTFLFGTVLPTLVNLTLLAFFLHTVVNHKFIGHVAVILSYVLTALLPLLNIEHNLVLFASGPTLKYSDMNRFGPFVAPLFWFHLYWFTFALLLTLGAVLLSVRGTETAFKRRIRLAVSRLRPAASLAALALLCALLGEGRFIYINTNIRHDYTTTKDANRLRAAYERQYRHFLSNPLPRITDVRITADLFPERLQYHLYGVYLLKNKTNRPITEIPIDYHSDLTLRTLAFDRPATRTLYDRRQGFCVYCLSKPLQPGEQLTLRFDLPYEKQGFPNDQPDTSIAGNGTFLSTPAPRIGYQEDAELTDETERKKQGLPDRPVLPSLDDLNARRNTYIANDADWIHFEATVSTAPDQIAVAPGYLKQEWTDHGRRCFRYVMDAPIRNFYAFLSARYAVRRDRWHDVALEIYYHPDHAYNLERMMRGMKKALDYYTTNFGPYQFRQLRILEFPCYQDFAESFPNTVPYSEGIGFIAHVSGPGDIDYPFYVTAHETAHQWWAHQVIGGNVEGAEMLSESLAEYSALMVMQHEYGKQQMRKFLHYDLDQYLQGRGAESDEEYPLMRSKHQPYIHYNKGSLVFYALQDYIGEAKLNGVLARFLHDKAYQEPPYTTSAELVQYLRRATPPSLQYLITDLFEKITLYNNSAQRATYSRIAPGKYRVVLTVAAQKLYADGHGNETVAPLKDAIDIGVFAKAGPGEDLGRPLVLEKRVLTQPVTTLEYVVNAVPAVAGIDPYNKLIDRNPNDNTIAVQPATH